MRMRAMRFKMTVATLGWMTLLLLMLTLTIPGPAHAATFFDTDFEMGSSGCDWAANGWNDFGQAPCSGPMTISTAKAISGTHSLHLNYVTLNNTQSVTATPSIYRSSWTPATHIFMRFAISVDADFQISPYNTKLIRIHEGTVYPRPWFSLNSGTYQMRIEGPFDTPGNVDIMDTGIAPNRGNWDQIEMEWQLNTCGQSNGLMRIWVNGVLRIERVNRAWIGEGAGAGGLVSSCSYLIKGLQVYLQNGINDLHYDRIAVGDTRIGLAASHASSDTTPPAAPSGLQLR